MMGVWTYEATALEEFVDGVGATLRGTRKVAENRLVRGRRCWMVRRNSTLWRFFCRG